MKTKPRNHFTGGNGGRTEVRKEALGLARAEKEASVPSDDFVLVRYSEPPEPRAMPARGMIRIGSFTLTHCPPGKVWIENAAREGMATDEAKLESLLEKFWRKEF